MGRIGASLAGVELSLLNRLAEAQSAVALSNLRLATGRKIVAPRDNPTGFVDVSQLRTRLRTVTSTITNVGAASTVASEAQFAVDAVKTQLDLIRAKLVEDEDGALSGAQRTANQAVIDSAIAEINRLATSEVAGRRLFDGSAAFGVSGRNPNQVANVRVLALGGPSTLSARQPAELTYTGAAGKISANATVTIAGNSGQATYVFTTSDTLTAAAVRINDNSAATGVRAVVDGNSLKLQSASTGESARVQVSVGAGSFVTSGGNGAGLALGTSGAVAAAAAISGRVVEAATQATLTHNAGGANIAANATFTLSGKRGSASIAVTTADTLGQAVARVNAASHKTGVAAAVDGTTIVFTSVEYGTSASVGVEVASGAFATTGGNGDGTANGANAVAEINGRRLAGNRGALAAALVHEEATGSISHNATFTLTGALGDAVIGLTAGQTLAQARDAINLEQATTGVVASVDADNLRLILTSTTPGAGEQVEVEVTAGLFTAAAGEGLSLDAFTPERTAELRLTRGSGIFSLAADFDLTGELGTANIVVNPGDTLVQVRDAINVETPATGVVASLDGATLVLRSANPGPDGQVTVALNSGSFTTDDGAISDFGANATTVVSGLDEVDDVTTVDGNRFFVRSAGSAFEIEFAAGFTGEFSTIALSPGGARRFALGTDVSSTTTLAVAGLQAAQLGGLSGTLDQLATGGDHSGLGANASRAIRIVDEALADYYQVQGAVDGFANAAVASSAGLLVALQTQLEDAIVTADGFDVEEEQLQLLKNEALLSNATAALAVLAQQRYGILDLIRSIAGLRPL